MLFTFIPLICKYKFQRCPALRLIYHISFLLMSARNLIRLKYGRDASLKKGHPWLFSGAFDKIENCTESGELADIVNSDGKFLARTILLPTVSVWTRDESEQIDSKVFYFEILFHCSKNNQIKSNRINSFSNRGSTTRFNDVVCCMATKSSIGQQRRYVWCQQSPMDCRI